jgi:phage tail protein X
MKIALISLLLTSMYLVPARSHAQQWSKDPVVDRIDKAMAEYMDFRDRENYCHDHRNQDSTHYCDGYESHESTVIMDYDEAVKLGQKQLDKQKAVQMTAQTPVPQRSLGEIAREQNVLKIVRGEIPGICEKKPDAALCKSDYAAREAFISKIVAANPGLQAYIKTGILPAKPSPAASKSSATQAADKSDQESVGSPGKQ